jgi:5-formyltetrahydrofolate cyclo-ligase
MPVVFAPGQALVRGEYGIPEPPPGSAETGVQDLSLVCLPGVAFGLDGSRLGYGGGYYDRLLRHPAFRAVTCGLAFDLQVVCALPRDAFDGTVDVIVTESQTIRPAGTECVPGPGSRT